MAEAETLKASPWFFHHLPFPWKLKSRLNFCVTWAAKYLRGTLAVLLCSMSEKSIFMLNHWYFNVTIILHSLTPVMSITKITLHSTHQLSVENNCTVWCILFPSPSQQLEPYSSEVRWSSVRLFVCFVSVLTTWSAILLCGKKSWNFRARRDFRDYVVQLRRLDRSYVKASPK